MSWLRKKQKKWQEGGANKFGGQFSASRQIHKGIKESRDKAVGKDLAKDAEREQVRQAEVIGMQQQREELKLAEATSEVQKKKLLSRQGGNQSLMRTLG